MSSVHEEQMITQKELQDYLKVSKSWIDVRVARDPNFPVRRIGGLRRFYLCEVLSYLELESLAA
jgi:predicted DNA-binding transcriptional regulator AlpA